MHIALTAQWRSALQTSTQACATAVASTRLPFRDGEVVAMHRGEGTVSAIRLRRVRLGRPAHQSAPTAPPVSMPSASLCWWLLLNAAQS